MNTIFLCVTTKRLRNEIYSKIMKTTQNKFKLYFGRMNIFFGGKLERYTSFQSDVSCEIKFNFLRHNCPKYRNGIAIECLREERGKYFGMVSNDFHVLWKRINIEFFIESRMQHEQFPHSHLFLFFKSCAVRSFVVAF